MPPSPAERWGVVLREVCGLFEQIVLLRFCLSPWAVLTPRVPTASARPLRLPAPPFWEPGSGLSYLPPLADWRCWREETAGGGGWGGVGWGGHKGGWTGSDCGPIGWQRCQSAAGVGVGGFRRREAGEDRGRPSPFSSSMGASLRRGGQTHKSGLPVRCKPIFKANRFKLSSYLPPAPTLLLLMTQQDPTQVSGGGDPKDGEAEPAELQNKLQGRSFIWVKQKQNTINETHREDVSHPLWRRHKGQQKGLFKSDFLWIT